MDEIRIDPNGGKIAVRIKFNSMQIISYAYRIFNTEESEVFQKESGDSREDIELNTRELERDPMFYSNKKIRISVDLVDPQGAGNKYSISVKILQNGETCGSPIELSGETTDNETYIVRWRKFTN